ncbi:hypothetical protein [Staphylococcus pasteuri]|uniref:DUF1270 family protein n=1 Tax=Staphylococcus pasteuri TaxID=45972 RepID=A0ABY1H8F1_9STAP|nr:hypothetical protein [Staphylococcus pasteuri]SFZ78075.1 hypothetical protein SAMN03097721_02094 [Staphylococcus pasteuri]SFZ78549.1 hypothetical protein SAMN03097721_02304 [Staphylococcus pasteuri]
MNKSFLISLLSWIILSLFFTFAGIHFITAVGSAALISLIALVFFEYVYFDNEKKTEC